MTTRRVIVVEDNEDFRELLAMSVRSFGHDVETAADGEEGIRGILEGAPSIALIDIGLPDMDGHTVAQRVRSDARGMEIALVALTGYGLPEERDKALANGFDGVLVKPVDSNLLNEVIGACDQRADLARLCGRSFR